MASRFCQKSCTHLLVLCNIGLKFGTEPRFCKHAKFSKVNATEKFGVDFFAPSVWFFGRFGVNYLTISNLLKVLKTRVFSSKSFLAQNS